MKFGLTSDVVQVTNLLKVSPCAAWGRPKNGLRKRLRSVEFMLLVRTLHGTQVFTQTTSLFPPKLTGK